MKKNSLFSRIFSIALIVILVFGFLPAEAFAESAYTVYTDQTEAGDYSISTAEQLQTLAEKVNEGTSYSNSTFILTADIDLSSVCSKTAGDWTPIGSESNPFAGTFDGGGHEISNLYYNGSATDGTDSYVGLFGKLSDSTISHINLTGVDITGDQYAGGIFGYAESVPEISACSVEGSITTGGKYAGGIGGYASSVTTVKDCYASVEITSSSGYVGGIAGYLQSTALENCYAVGLINAGSNSNVGGIAGYIYFSSRIENCVALQSSISCGTSNVGRVVGGNIPFAVFSNTISGCYAYEGMTLSGSTVDSDDAAGTDGADLSSVEALSAVTYANLEWIEYDASESPYGWVLTDCKLPYIFNELTADYISAEEADVLKIRLASQIAGAVSLRDSVPVSTDGMDISTVDYWITQTDYNTFDTAISEAQNVYNSDSSTLNDVDNQLMNLESASNTFISSKRSGLKVVFLDVLEANYETSYNTEENALEITSAQDLADFAVFANENTSHHFENKYVKITQDIDLSTICSQDLGSWTPISNAPGLYFSGTFDGSGHTISNLYHSSHATSENTYGGLFGYIKNYSSSTITSTPTIKNINLTNVDITTAGGYVGGIAGGAAGSSSSPVIVENCSVTGHINTSDNVACMGGIIGRINVYTTIQNCCFLGAVSSTRSSGTYYTGGIIGYSGGSNTIADCYAAGTISTLGTEACSGGIGGRINSDGVLSNCFALQSSITVDAENTNTARIAGSNDGTISGCCAYSDMIINGMAAGSGNTADDLNGADITAGEALTGSAYTDAGWLTDIWTMTDGKLPYITDSGAPTEAEITAWYGYLITASGGTDVPTLTEAEASNISSRGAAITFTSNKAGTLYYVVYEAAADAPSLDTIKSRTGTAISAGENSFEVRTLSAVTAYTTYVVVEDASGSTSEIAEIGFTTTAEADTTAPVLSETGAEHISPSSAAVRFTSNEAGTGHYVVYEAGEDTPSLNTIKSRTGTAISAGENSLEVSGLTAETAYTAYVVVEDASGNISEIAEIDFTTTAEAVIVPETVEVKLSAQKENTFFFAPQIATVSSDLAENYGYTDSVNGVSALDVLVRAHEIAYDSDFDATTAETYLSVNETGLVLDSFKQTATSFGFVVNGISPNDGVYNEDYKAYTGYAITEAEIDTDDQVEFIFYQDGYWLDNYIWFIQDGMLTDEITASAGSPTDLTINGYCIGYYGCNYTSLEDAAAGIHVEAIEDVQLALVDTTNGAFTDIENAVTDGNGDVSVTFSTAGTYVLTAYMPQADIDSGATPVFMPLKTVVVSDNTSLYDTIAANYASGYNSEATALELDSAQGLKDLAAFVNEGHDFAGKYVRLTADIDLESVCSETAGNWAPIGNEDNPFIGTFDGCGHTVSNLYYSGTSDNGSDTRIGLFGELQYKGYTGNHAAIRNLRLTNVDITGYSFVGGIAGKADSSVIIENCCVSGSVSGIIHTGGIIGYTRTVTIDNCYSVADVTTLKGDAGGICGFAYLRTNISHCYSVGTISASNSDNEACAGGIAGSISNMSSVKNSVALQSSISVESGSVGRIVGDNIANPFSGTISDSYAWKGMTVNGSVVSSSAIDGTDLTAADALNGNAYTVLGWTPYDASSKPYGWVFEDGKLPCIQPFGEVSEDYTYLTDAVGEDVKAPILSDASCIAAGATYAIFRFDSTEIGTYHCLVLPAGGTAPDSDTLKSTGTSGPASTENSFSMDGLTASASYIAYIVVTDALENTSDITQIPFETGQIDDTAIPPLINGIYKISTGGQLAWFRDLVNGTLTDGTEQNTAANAVLTADIDLSSVCGEAAGSWIPIGSFGNAYTGTFDGAGYRISNLYIHSDKDEQALFGCVNNSIIKDLTVMGSVTSAEKSNAAGIAAYDAGSSRFIGCHNGANITGNAYVGGIAGRATLSSFEGCENTGDITGNEYVGGVVGDTGKSLVLADCENTASVTGKYCTGGIAGCLNCENSDKITLSGCANSGEVTCDYSGTVKSGRVGGLFGYVGLSNCSDISSVNNSYNTGAVTDNSGEEAGGCAGGLGGSISCGDCQLAMTDCYSSGSISGINSVGGLVGQVTARSSNTDIMITNCYSAASFVTNTSGLSATLGGTIGQTSLEEDASSEAIFFSNLFYLDGDVEKGIGDDSADTDVCITAVKSSQDMQKQVFVTQIGGAYTLYSEGIAEIEGDVPDAYASRFSEYEYPILRSWMGLEDKETFNVQFMGAQYGDVTIDGEATYATTVASGQDITFTVTSKYQEVTLTSVSVDGNVLTPGGDGSYTLSNITADTVIAVAMDGEPELSDEQYDVTFTTDPSNAAIEIKSEEGVVLPEQDGTYNLKAGEYTCTVIAEGYHTKTGTFTVAGDMAFTITLAQGETRTVTADSSVKADIISDGLVIDEVPAGQEAAELQLYEGAYTYTSDWGGGSFTISEDMPTSLRKVDFSNKLMNPDYVLYTMSVVDDNGISYSPGGTKYTDEDARAHFLLPVQNGDLAYNYTFNVPGGYWGGSGSMYIYDDQDFHGLNLSDSGRFIIKEKAEVAITVPKEAELHLYHRVKFYHPLEELMPKSEKDNGSTITCYYDAPDDTRLHYELNLDGYVKKADVIDTSKEISITVSENDLTEETGKDIADSTYAADIVMNAPNSKYIELDSGEQFELYCFRNWQAINSITGNYYVDPDYHVELICGDSVKITDPYYAGATIRAAEGKSGISIVRVTYDALDYLDTGRDSYLYSKLWEQNTAVLVFNVNPQGSAEIDTGISLTENDIVYYTRSINGITLEEEDQYAEYTFTPAVTDSGIACVSIHAPVGSTDAWDDSAWTDMTENGDGSYTVKLTDGISVIRATAKDGTAAYHAAKAYGLDITIESDNVDVNLEDGRFDVTTDINDQVEISFDGLEMTCPKLGAIYNPGFQDTTYISYTMTGQNTGTGNEIESEHTQYFIADTNTITLNFDSPDTYILSGGKIPTTSMGEGKGGHRAITKGGMTGQKSSYTEGEDSEEHKIPGQCSLPDITFKVEGVEDFGDAYDVTITVPEDMDSLTVRNDLGYIKSQVSASGSTYTYSLVNNDSTATYTYYAERDGYITQVGTFNVVDSDVAVDLTALEWTPVSQSGTAAVNIIGYETVLSDNSSVTISDEPADLASKRYVLYNYGGYTVLHGLVDALDQNKADFECSDGILLPDITISGTAGDDACWICEVNGIAVSDYSTVLLNDNDSVVFYYNPATADSMRHAWFTDTEVSAARDGFAELTLVSTSVSNDGSDAAAVAGATVYIDGKSWGTTDSGGKITISGLSNLALGPHTVTAQIGGTLTFARARLTIKKASDSAIPEDGYVTVSFRLIGDTKHDAAYDGYINWIKTKRYKLEEGSTVEDLFTMVLDSKDMKYDDTSDNYVAWIRAPEVLGEYKLAEFTNGNNSGWMYTVNGIHVLFGVMEQELEDGDEIIWHYVNDYTLETTFEDSIAKYINPWLNAKDVDPYEEMEEESQNKAEKSRIRSDDDASSETIRIAPKVNASGGKAAVEIDKDDIKDAVNEVQKNNGKKIIIAPDIKGDADKVTVTLPKASVSLVSEENGIDLSVETEVGNMTLSGKTLASIAEQAEDDSIEFSLEVMDKETLTAEQKTAVGDNTVYDISILNGDSHISSFGGNSITISLLYTLQEGERADGVGVWYLNDKGQLEQISCTYDEETGMASFTATHLSYYVVACDESADWKNPFNDVSHNDWYYDAVKYADKNGLMSGTSETTFEPGTVMTRAMLVTILYRLEGAPAVAAANRFADVTGGQWYTDAVIWASANGIVSGYGSGLFGTNDSITRQQIAVILYNYAVCKGYDIALDSDLTTYTDFAEISDWAVDAMKWANAEALITGRTEDTLVPTGTAARSEGVTIFMRLIEDVINE